MPRLHVARARQRAVPDVAHARQCAAFAVARAERALFDLARARQRALGGASFAALALWAAPVAAEAPAYPLTWSQEVLLGEQHEESRESPELRTLRLAEEELFRPGPAERPDSHEPDRGGAVGPQHAPPERFEHAGGSVDVSFLKQLKLPELPVRWDGRVIEYLLFFKDDPRGRELAGAWLKRRERYGAMVRRILAEHTLPADLQYVAMVESGYDPSARSAADAWGMWQFVQEPAEHYGLRVDHWVDERLDPERSTRAAARFLRDLHERFGSWELAFAAYNMGYGSLLRAIKKYNTNDYWLLSRLEAGLPFETSLYVAKIIAMAIVAHNPERFGFSKLAPEPAFAPAKVDVAAGTPLERVAEVAGVSLEQLARVNPHLLRSRVPPGEPSAQVYVPREAQVRFVQRWSSQKQGAPLIGYTLRQGEGLDEVARRTGISMRKLRELNELSDDSPVQSGFALLLPAGARPTKDLVEPLVATVPARDFRYEGRRRVFYRVAPEDTSASVARFFDLSTDELALWNSLALGAALQPGMLLQLFVPAQRDLSRAVVYTPDEVRILTVGSDEFFAYHEAQRKRIRVRYRVRRDDTIAGLARRFDLSPGSIGRINQFASDRELTAGEWVTLYVPEAELAALEDDGRVQRLGQRENERAAPGREAAHKAKESASEPALAGARAALERLRAASEPAGNLRERADEHAASGPARTKEKAAEGEAAASAHGPRERTSAPAQSSRERASTPLANQRRAASGAPDAERMKAPKRAAKSAL